MLEETAQSLVVFTTTLPQTQPLYEPLYAVGHGPVAAQATGIEVPVAGSSCTCPICMSGTFVVRKNRTSVCPHCPHG